MAKVFLTWSWFASSLPKKKNEVRKKNYIMPRVRFSQQLVIGAFLIKYSVEDLRQKVTPNNPSLGKLYINKNMD